MQKNTHDLSFGFDRDRNRIQQELANNKNQKGKFHLRIMLKGIFGFAEHHEKVTLGLGYKLRITGTSDSSASNKDNATNIGKIKNNSIEWYVPH